MTQNVRIVLINTSHPGNIGSAARAMKTMGFYNLYLVDPLQFPHPKAKEMAVSAGDLVDGATVVKTLDEAIGDCKLVIGTSARIRTIPWPLLSPRELAARVAAEPEAHQIAILFGREQNGLTNDELARCNYHVHIPSNPEYSSLNLAAAVQIITYELRLSVLEKDKAAGQVFARELLEPLQGPETADYWDYRLATASELEGFYDHFQTTLVNLAFMNPEAPRKLMTRLRRLFTRARPDVMEVNILRGMFSAIRKRLERIK